MYMWMKNNVRWMLLVGGDKFSREIQLNFHKMSTLDIVYQYIFQENDMKS